MKSTHCPSCGAPVKFQSAASVYAVCAFCHSTLLNDGRVLKNLGRMAELIDDHSPIQISTKGRIDKKRFSVIGRIQLAYDAGVWNEWHLLLGGARSAWLSEASGEYVFSERASVTEAIPDFDALSQGMRVRLAKIDFQVANLVTARCVAGQGELPFKVDAGYDTRTADLRSAEGHFATIDYSETPPLVFLGRPLSFDDLHLTNLKSAVALEYASDASEIKVESFNCPHCAAPLKIHSLQIQSITCGGCGSLIGVENEKVSLLAEAARGLRAKPRINLGTRGSLEGVEWEVIGFLRRRIYSEGLPWFWDEYLLFNGKKGFSWLTEYNGHWNFARMLSNFPLVKPGDNTILYDKRGFRLFSSGVVETTVVVGEFYWVARAGDTCQLDEYVSPPSMLSRENFEDEVTWTRAEYLEGDAVASAFNVKSLPKASGVYANQPNPWKEHLGQTFAHFLAFVLLGSVIQLAFLFFIPQKKIFQQDLTVPASENAAMPNSSYNVTKEFTLPSYVQSLTLKHSLNIADDNWVEVATALVDKANGEIRRGVQDVASYKGERAPEGRRASSIRFVNVPPGTYYMVVNYDAGFELGAPSRPAIVDRVEIERRSVAWSNFVFLVVFLALFPLFVWLRHSAFEATRWEESDVGEDDDEDDDDGDIDIWDDD
ncbi:MAG: DUF4178 domain-containing protein [Candidatus Accumulibacter sp.]|nr:DUF4178 domain-containing protein [Accumulibacter sp.]